ncbi:MAG TPA: hypothetical protein VIA06_12580 [Candidatus Dormibacteraeota bacterium]|nr:hypothetical protein [Candidatus Dormibacteraeota bacterium]
MKANETTLITYAIVLVVICFAIARRMRPQPVRPNRLIVTAGLYCVILLASLGTAGPALIQSIPALILAPVCLIIGLGLGVVLVRFMTFWVDPQSGVLWMRGGVVFAVIFVVTLALRLGASFLLGGSSGFGPPSPGHSAPHGFLSDLSTDLIFLSVGMWASRAALLYNRFRQHQAGQLPNAPS